MESCLSSQVSIRIHHAADKLKTRLKFKRWKTRWRVVLSSQVYIHHTADKLKTRLKFKRWKTRWRVGKVPRYLYSVHHKADKLKTRLKLRDERLGGELVKFPGIYTVYTIKQIS